MVHDDGVSGGPVDVSSPSNRVERGGAAKPSFCDGTTMEDPSDIPLDNLMDLLDQATRDEVPELDREIMQIVSRQ